MPYDKKYNTKPYIWVRIKTKQVPYTTSKSDRRPPTTDGRGKTKNKLRVLCAICSKKGVVSYPFCKFLYNIYLKRTIFFTRGFSSPFLREIKYISFGSGCDELLVPFQLIPYLPAGFFPAKRFLTTIPALL
jgi:hypothetical protein